MILNKELAIGIYSGVRKVKNFTISWNTGTVVITAYQPGQPIGQNDFDRPRINTFRTDSTNIVYMSAGNVVLNPVTNTTSTPWGNRTTGTEKVNIALFGSLSAGVDLFTDMRLPAPTLVPSITQWLCAGTGNPNEIKYQYIINRNALPDQSISITL